VSFIVKDLEDAVEIVADWAVRVIQDVTKVLSPDGRPFEFVEQTDEEQLRDYYQYKGNEEAWATRIGEIAGEMVKKLQDSQVPESDITGIHPVDIAQKYLLSYSVHMEEMLRKNASE
jgi:hypothetical protein